MRGWFKDRYRHSLASRGIATEMHMDKVLKSGDIDYTFDDCPLFDLQRVDKYRSGNQVFIAFSLRGSYFNSSIIYDLDTNELNGVIRFSPLEDYNDVDYLKKKFNLSKDRMDGGIYYITDEIGLRFSDYKREEIVPHMNVFMENVNPKYLDDVIYKIYDYAEEVVYSDVYQE